MTSLAQGSAGVVLVVAFALLGVRQTNAAVLLLTVQAVAVAVPGQRGDGQQGKEDRLPAEGRRQIAADRGGEHRRRGEDDPSRAVLVAHLDGAEFLEVTRHRRLGRGDALFAQS